MASTKRPLRHLSLTFLPVPPLPRRVRHEVAWLTARLEEKLEERALPTLERLGGLLAKHPHVDGKFCKGCDNLATDVEGVIVAIAGLMSNLRHRAEQHLTVP